MKKVLAFFGAFNPPTNAHVNLAELAMKETGRERVFFVPSKSEYIVDEQKKEYSFDDGFRLDMLNDLAKARPWMDICRYDLESKTQPRTYETLCYLRGQGDDAALLIGSDVLERMEKEWKNVDKIAQEFGIVCLTRSSLQLPEAYADDPFLSPLLPHITFVKAPEEYLTKSSTAARRQYDQAIRYWKGLCGLVPPEAAARLLKKFNDIL